MCANTRARRIDLLLLLFGDVLAQKVERSFTDLGMGGPRPCSLRVKVSLGKVY